MSSRVRWRRGSRPRGGFCVRAELLAGLATGFGGISIRPIHALSDRPAIRVVVTAVLNSRKPAELLPAFVLNGPDGRLTDASEAVHRGRATLR
jgi:tRNA1(Val) A37 N6-methylase TrmN6